jgi:ribonuclease III
LENAAPGESNLTSLPERLGLDCETPTLEIALTHRSYAFERHGVTHNERLEFLGDSVLGLVVTDLIFRWYPELTEGEMAKLRSSIVNMGMLAEAARDLRLGADLLLGKGEEFSGGRDKTSILGDALEAVIGAAYLDCGWDRTFQLVEELFGERIREQAGGGPLKDFKTTLQELAVQISGGLPEYRISSSGPDHSKTFVAEVLVGGDKLGTGTGKSKKEAEQAAAHQALGRLGMSWPHAGPQAGR